MRNDVKSGRVKADYLNRLEANWYRVDTDRARIAL